MANENQIMIPGDAMRAIRQRLDQEVGRETATRALQEAGHAAGDYLFQRVEEMLGTDDPGTVPSNTFWNHLSHVARELGWGALAHQEIHPGVGALTATDWFELEPHAHDSPCPFTTGALSNVLGRVAGQDMAVMQVPCDHHDEQPCARFVFGAPAVLDELYSGLSQGQGLDTALTELG